MHMYLRMRDGDDAHEISKECYGSLSITLCKEGLAEIDGNTCVGIRSPLAVGEASTELDLTSLGKLTGLSS